MKKILSLLLAFSIMISLCACQGNFGSMDLKDSIAIPEDGVIKESIIKQIQSENAISIFTGKSGDYKYEWTIFGSDIADTKEINLQAQISKNADGDIAVTLTQTPDSDFVVSPPISFTPYFFEALL